jgi:hypothetical protein
MKPGASSSEAVLASLNGVPMRGWTSGSRTFTSAVPAKSAWKKPKSIPSHQFASPITTNTA